MFESMLDHPNIHIELGVDFSEIRNRDNFAHLAFTGPIDAYFDCRFGALPYRSLRFEHEHFSNLAQFQKTGTVNYPNDHAFTRITQFKPMPGQQHDGTTQEERRGGKECHSK